MGRGLEQIRSVEVVLGSIPTERTYATYVVVESKKAYIYITALAFLSS